MIKTNKLQKPFILLIQNVIKWINFCYKNIYTIFRCYNFISFISLLFLVNHLMKIRNRYYFTNILLMKKNK